MKPLIKAWLNERLTGLFHETGLQPSAADLVFKLISMVDRFSWFSQVFYVVKRYQGCLVVQGRPRRHRGIDPESTLETRYVWADMYFLCSWKPGIHHLVFDRERDASLSRTSPDHFTPWGINLFASDSSFWWWTKNINLNSGIKRCFDQEIWSKTRYSLGAPGIILIHEESILWFLMMHLRNCRDHFASNFRTILWWRKE